MRDCLLRPAAGALRHLDLHANSLRDGDLLALFDGVALPRLQTLAVFESNEHISDAGLAVLNRAVVRPARRTLTRLDFHHAVDCKLAVLFEGVEALALEYVRINDLDADDLRTV